MSAAVTATTELPPGALELIRAGTPQPKSENPVVAPKPAAVAPIVAAPSSPPLETLREQGLDNAARSQTRTKAKAEEAAELVTLVQDTYRLPAKYLEALAAAGFQRKTKRLRPFTKQHIVATALADWLIKEGYLTESER